jgi:hypothetical protein
LYSPKLFNNHPFYEKSITRSNRIARCLLCGFSTPNQRKRSHAKGFRFQPKGCGITPDERLPDLRQ